MTFSVLGIDTQTGQRVELPQASRRQGLYIIGANGTGKTGLIENLILQDIDQGLGVGLLDPHGDLTNAILAKMTKRQEDVILLDITDEDYPFGLNIFECPNPQSPKEVQKIVDLVMHIFEKLYDVSRQTPRMAQYLRNCTYTLVANPGYTMADIPLLLTDEICRRTLVANVTDPKTGLFWKNYDAMRPTEQREHAESTLNKLDEFLSPLVINIVGQAQTTVSMQHVMDERKILLVKLSALMEQVTSLIGSVIIAMVLNAAYSRANIPVNKRKQFNLYADEFQRFATEDFATLLTEARKFGIATTIAHQARYQPGMSDGIRAVSLQAANFVVFRITSPDADELAGGFDTTPPPPQTEEVGKEAVITYKRDVVGHLLHQGHENPAVERFVADYLQKINDARNRHDIDICGLIGVDYGKSEKQYGAEHSNHHVNRVHHLFTDYVHETRKRKGHYTSTGSGLYYAEKDSYRWDHDNYGSYWYNPTAVQNDLNKLNSLLYDTMRGKLTDEAIEPRLLQVLQDSGHTGLSAFLGCDTVVALISGLLNSTAQKAYVHILNFVKKYYAYAESLPDRTTLSKEEQSEHFYYLMNWCNKELRPWLDQLFSNYENAYDLNITAKVYDAEKNRYRWFKESLLAAIKALQQDPISTRESGRYETQVRLPPQRTYADMINDISNQLSGLPNFTARIRITIEGKTVEHTIKTLPPGQGIGKALQQRIADIQARNRDSRYGGYCRSRKKVEEEITKRQLVYSGSPAPQPQRPPQQPQPQRFARQVPLQGKCSNCGFSNNPPGAKFCSNCGRKL